MLAGILPRFPVSVGWGATGDGVMTIDLILTFEQPAGLSRFAAGPAERQSWYPGTGKNGGGGANCEVLGIHGRARPALFL